VKILATADWHLSDTRRLGGSSMTIDGVPLALARSKATLAWIADVAMEEEVDLIIHAGDLYHSPRPSPATEDVAVRSLLELSELAPVVVLVGNHDRPTGSGAHALLPLRHLAPGRLYVADDAQVLQLRCQQVSPRNKSAGSADATIFPLPYPPRAGGDSAAIGAALQAQYDHHVMLARSMAGMTILAAHVSLVGAMYGLHQAVTAQDVTISPMPGWHAFDFPFAGHLHLAQDLAPGILGYVGAPDRFDFGDASNTPRVVIWDQGDVREIPHPSPMRFCSLAADSDIEQQIGEISAAVGAKPSDVAFRVIGEVSPKRHAELSAQVRHLRHSWIVKNEATVARSERTRVVVLEQESSDDLALVEKVIASRPELEPHRLAVLSRLGGLLGN